MPFSYDFTILDVKQKGRVGSPIAWVKKLLYAAKTMICTRG